MTKNEIFETVALAVAEKTEYRAVAQFHGEHEGETLLVDFAYDDGTEFSDGRACTWSLQKDIRKEDGSYGGTYESDFGLFETFTELLTFLETLFDGKEVDFYAESF